MPSRSAAIRAGRATRRGWSPPQNEFGASSGGNRSTRRWRKSSRRPGSGIGPIPRDTMSKVRRAGRGRAVRPDPSMGKASERSSLVIVPLTDRILAITPGPRWIWIVLWSLLAIPLTFFLQRLIQAVEPSSQALAGGLPGPWFSAAIVNATLLSLWGARKLAVDTVRTEAAISRLILDERPDAGRPIRGMDSILGPIALTFVLAGGRQVGLLQVVQQARPEDMAGLITRIACRAAI